MSMGCEATPTPMARTQIATACLVLLAALLPEVMSAQGTSQGLTTTIAPARKDGVNLTATFIEAAGWGSSTDLNGFESAGQDPFVVRYRYDEQNLMPEGASGSYLDLRIFRRSVTTQPTAWRERWQLTVSGQFLDTTVPLVLRVHDGVNEKAIELSVRVHQFDASNAVELVEREVELQTNAGRPLHLSLRNKTPFPISIVNDKCSAVLDGLPGQALPCEVAGDLVDTKPMTVGIAPRGWSAFWRSVAPYSIQSPHDTLTVDLRYKVRNGGTGRLEQRVAVKDVPSLPLVILAVMIGALLGSIPRAVLQRQLLPAGPVVGAAPGSASWFHALAATARVVGSSVALSVIIFLLYLFVKGDKKVVLFDYPLDPFQCMPGLLIGALVGLRPDYWYQRVIGTQNPKAVVAFVLMSLAARAEAFDFHPVAIEIERVSGGIFVLSSPENVIYEVVGGDGGALVARAQLDRIGAAADICVGGAGDRAWFAVSLVAPAASQNTPWRSSVLFGDLPLLAREGRWARADGGTWGRYHGVACGEDGELLVTDLQAEEIRAFRVANQRVERMGRWAGDRRLGAALALLSGSNYVLTGDVHGGVLLEAQREPAGKRRSDLREVAKVKGPAGLALGRDGKRVLIADVAAARILSYDRSTHSVSTLFESSELQSPVDVAEDGSGGLWIADAGARAIFLVRTGSIQRAFRIP